MGALANAAALARDQEFRARALAAAIYQARSVIVDPASIGTVRERFATQLLLGPAGFMDSVAWALAADPAVATLGSTAAAVPEQTMLDQTLAAWDYLAAALVPGQ